MLAANHLDSSVKAAREEVAADYAGQLMSDGDTMEQFIQQNQHRPSLLKRLAEAFRELWRKLTGKERTQAEEAAYRLEKAYARAVEEAKKGGNTGGRERLSIKNTSKLPLKEQLRRYYAGELNSSDSFYFGETPDTLLDTGLNRQPLVLTISAFKKSTKVKHNVPRRVLNNLQNNLSHALFAFVDGDRTGIVIDDIDGDGKQVLVAIKKDVYMDRIPVNEITSIYGIDSPVQWLRNQIEERKKFVLLDKNKANAFLQTYGYLASVEGGIRSTSDFIAQSAQNVNTKLSKKERQFQTIQQSNPAADEYHTWIRSADEIRTFEEALADPEWDYSEFDPDYTRAMAEDALQSGEITVYSSHPISEGVFVSPSRMEAESYSGNGKVYSETVSLDDVAWIDPTQGQYAPIDTQTNTSSRASLRTDAELEAAVREIQQKREAGELSAEEAREQIIQKGEEAYQRMIEQYGEIQQGEKPARQISVPKQTSKDTKVTQTIRTVLEARVTPDMAVPDIKTMVARGAFSYEVIGDKATISDAKAKIVNDGWANAYSAWMQDMKKGVYTKVNTALGAELYNNAVNHGDVQMAMDILMELAASQRAAGQVVQATKIIKQLSPEAQLFGVARGVKSIQEELNRRYGDENAPTLIISEELAEQYMKADTEQARENALSDIYKNIGEQIPPTFTDKWNAWRYLAMLGNPRTQVRNVLGNLFFAPVVMAKNAVGMMIVEPAGQLLSGKKSGKSKSFYTRDLYRAALSDYANVESEIMNGAKYNDSAMQNSAIREGQRIFRFKPLEARLKLTGLKEAAERLHQQPSAEGYSVKGRRTMARLFIPDLVFPEHIEMGENIFLYFGDMTECYVLYWLRQS